MSGKSIPSRGQLDEAFDPIAAADPDQPGLFDTLPEACEHSTEQVSKDQPNDPCYPGSETVSGAITEACTQAGPQCLGVDPAAGSSLSVADEPARRSAGIPPRIADRGHPEEWADDELLTLPEAAALFWPAGPITTNTLRTAARDGTVAITRVAGKFFTTPMAIRRMGVDETGTLPASAKPDAASAQAHFQRKLEEARRIGRERKRRQRAAKRSAGSAAIGVDRQ